MTGLVGQMAKPNKDGLMLLGLLTFGALGRSRGQMPLLLPPPLLHIVAIAIGNIIITKIVLMVIMPVSVTNIRMNTYIVVALIVAIVVGLIAIAMNIVIITLIVMAMLITIMIIILSAHGYITIEIINPSLVCTCFGFSLNHDLWRQVHAFVNRS
jgi:hypothetical protein